jgi:hypothetical protein
VNTEESRRQNLEAARIILAAPERYEGLPLEWARRVLSLEVGQGHPGERGQFELFRTQGEPVLSPATAGERG